MSFGLSISDVALCVGFAHKLWQQARDAPGDFQAVAAEVANLELVLKEVQDAIHDHVLGQSKQGELTQLLKGCRGVLVDLEVLLNKYHGLGAQSRRTWDRLRWGKEPIEKIRLRLISHVSLLSSFCSGLFGYALSLFEFVYLLH